MPVTLANFLLPPAVDSYEQEQKAKILQVTALAIFVAALFFAIQNLVIYPDVPSAVAFFLLSGISLIALRLNHLRHFKLAGLLLGASVLAVLDYALFQGGANLHDTGIVAYPIFIFTTTFYFGKRGLILSAFLSIVSVAGLYWLEAKQIAAALYPAAPSRVIGLTALFVVTGLITWVIRVTWEAHLRNLQQAYDLTLQGWAKALEYRDGETEGHSQRVTDLCIMLARKLDCSEEETANLRRGALLHDIGKMAIPDRILFKVGPLDDQEWEIMRQHPALGVKMISGIPFLRSTVSVLEHHHEYWDGSGYPEGLKGERIPFVARIFTVVDHWDALNSDRPYRKAWTREGVIDHLKENSGKLYDPRVVKAFLTIVAEKGV